jgi:twitching motility protein PilT
LRKWAFICTWKETGALAMSGKLDPRGRRRRATDAQAGPIEQITPSIDSLLEYVAKMKASDLHIAAGVPPTIRVDGDLITVPNAPLLSPEMTEHLVQSIMTALQWEKYERECELDFSFGRRGLGRYRVSAFRERGDASAVLRTIPARALQLDELGLPAVLGEFAWLKQGLVLVTGPSGSGKTTTLTAIIDKINRDRNVHIITIEDPIEFVHTHERAIVQQRELGKDTESVARALRSAVREDPDVLLIGEMRDPETIAATVSAAETGHLVFATLHTNSAAQSVERIIDAFPPHQQTQIRYQLAGSLQAIVAQRLIPQIKGGRAVVAEVLLANGAVRNLIREGKTHQIQSAMHSGIKEGMVIFDMRLAEMVRKRQVHREVALSYCMDPRSFEERIYK